MCTQIPVLAMKPCTLAANVIFQFALLSLQIIQKRAVVTEIVQHQIRAVARTILPLEITAKFQFALVSMQRIQEFVQHMVTVHFQIIVLVPMDGLMTLVINQFALESSTMTAECAAIEMGHVFQSTLVLATRITLEATVQFQFVMVFQQTQVLFALHRMVPVFATTLAFATKITLILNAKHQFALIFLRIQI